MSLSREVVRTACLGENDIVPKTTVHSSDNRLIEIEYATFGSPSNPAILMIMGYTAQMIVWPQAFCQVLADAGYFVIIFDNEKDCENIFWVAFSLWKSKFWHQHLVGSVISFLRLPDFKKEFFSKSAQLMEEYEAHVKHVEALKLLAQKEKQFHENINLINDMRRVILYRYVNK